MPASWVVLYCILWAAVVLLAVLVIGLSKRVDRLSTVIPAPRHAYQGLGAGPQIGTKFPRVLGGVPLGAARGHRVVLFLSSSCGPCRALAASLRSRPSAPAEEDLELVLVTDDEGLEAYAGLPVSQVLVDHGREITRQLGVNATPFGVGLNCSGIVSANGVPHSWTDLVSLAGKCDASCSQRATPVEGVPRACDDPVDASVARTT